MDDFELGRYGRVISEMIQVPMRNNGMVEVVEFRDILKHGQNAVSVSSSIVGIARIDQRRFPFGRHEDRGSPSFDIHEINIQSPIVRPREQPI